MSALLTRCTLHSPEQAQLKKNSLFALLNQNSKLVEKIRSQPAHMLKNGHSLCTAILRVKRREEQPALLGLARAEFVTDGKTTK
jgi:hypothetical protein